MPSWMRAIRRSSHLAIRCFCMKPPLKEDLNAILCRQIRSAGPISVAEYMKIVMHHPIHGYYTNFPVLGPDGDFITSPEISQIFGEILGIWIVNEWMKYNKNTPFDIVEFGPGRGTLMATVIKVLCKFPTGSSLFRHLYFVERSDRLRELQKSVISPILKTYCINPELSWHSSLDEIPGGCVTFYLANEFFDALPIYRFQQVDGEWREVFVSVMGPSNPVESGDQLAFVTSPSSTIAASTYLPLAGDLSNKNYVEICPEAGAILQKIASRIATDGGSALISDYGHLGECGDTLRAFKDHKLHDPLKDPGQADITADVDFAFLRRSVEATKEPVIFHGPVSQAYFLVHMGIPLRLKVLVERTTSEEDKKGLIAATEMLIGSNQMGKRFKFMALTPGRSEKEKEYIPAGFYPTWDTNKA
ncbi:protein midA mitochondrial [Echinococcus multilocularis]|uniref:Protein arginine methyltransferase NDUFAF7 n=1 Tax=Echinococcus multilocularis TaxID=6211 RepID=A0A068YGJ5_ECHMU|nr:protein midA mitochondrial [Echinococcus multilocularis]